MDKDDLVKLTEALGELGYEIKKLNYIETETSYCGTARDLKLTLSLPNIRR